MNPVLIVIPILAVLMFSIGLSLRSEDFRHLSRQPLAMLAGIAGQLLLLPILALIIISALNLTNDYAIGLLLIACCPGGSSSNILSKLAGGDVALSVSLTAVNSLITLITLPIFMAVGLNILGITSADIHVPVDAMFMQNILLMLVPIMLGFILRKFRPATAKRIDRVIDRLSFPALVLVASIFFIQHYVTFANNFQCMWLSVTLLLVVSMLTGGLTCKILAFDNRIRRTLVIEIGIQNAAQAIALASSPFVFANDIIAIPAIVYALMMNILLLGYIFVVRHQTQTEQR